MKVKNEKGITLISLIITVIILAILAYVTITISIGLTGTVKFENIQTYLLIIQSKSEVLSNEKVIGNIDESGLFGELQESGDYAGWYKLSQGDLNEIGVKDAKAKERILCEL